MHKNYTTLSSRLALLALSIVLLLLLLFTRLFRITQVPSAVSHDELYYAIQARTIALSGSDPTGTWRPWYLTAADPLYAELPGVVMSPFAWLFPGDPLLAAKLPFVVLGSVLVCTLALLTWHWTRDRRTTIVVFCIATFNPWLFQFSRMGFDSLFSLSFYFVGMMLLIRAKGYAKLWSLAPLCLGFFQYQGMKVVFVPMVLATCVYALIADREQQRTTRPALIRQMLPLCIIAVTSVLLMASYLTRTVLNPDTLRASSDLIFSDRATNAALVDTDRQQAIASPFTSFFSNKAVTMSKRFAEQYLASFNPTHLFLTGEPLRNPFSVWKWGMFHLLDVVLIALGCIYLAQSKSHRWTGVFLLILLLIAPLPSALNAKGLWVMFRSALMIPVFILIAGFGAQYVLTHWSTWMKWSFAGAYVMTLLFFGFEYFYKYPVYGTQGIYFAERVIASYIQRTPSTKRVLVLADEPQFVYEALLLFTNGVQKETLPDVQNAFRSKSFTMAHWQVRNTCFDPSEVQEDTIVISAAANPDCPGDQQVSGDASKNAFPQTAIPSLLDSGALFSIHNDVVCGGHDLGRFSHVTQNVFAVDTLDDAMFCQSFITRE